MKSWGLQCPNTSRDINGEMHLKFNSISDGWKMYFTLQDLTSYRSLLSAL